MHTPNGHQISEVAARTGFSASALRFYERAGLVEPGRTPAGYRTYDDHTVERLRFIARAKDLGLALDDIAGLLPAWEGEPCAAVAGQLADRVRAKVADTRSRIAGLTAFAADLDQAAHRLTHDVGDGPCGDGCACTAAPTLDRRRAVAVAVGTRPAAASSGEPAPIACTLTAGQAAHRLGEWSGLLASQTGTPRRHVTGTTASVTVTFDPDPTIAARAAELAAAEQACCAFIDFAIAIDRSGTTLTATTNADAGSVLDALLGLAA